MAISVKEAIGRYIQAKIPEFMLNAPEFQDIVRGVDCYIQANNLERFEKYATTDPQRFGILVGLELAMFDTMPAQVLRAYFKGYSERVKIEEISYQALQFARARQAEGTTISQEQYLMLINRFYEATTLLAADPSHQEWLDEISEQTVDDLKYAHGLQTHPSSRLSY